MKRAAAIIVSLLVIVAAAEWSACRVVQQRRQRRAITLPPQARSSAYRGVSWASDYWREWAAAARIPDNLRETKSGILRLAPFRGKAITIDGQGLRVTPGSDCSPSAVRIAMFGGSMLWGHGSDDARTIPSLLAQRFRSAGRPACIRNYAGWGVSAPVSLAELGRLDWKPDIVVFYVGSYEVKDVALGGGTEMDALIQERRNAPRTCIGRLVRRDKAHGIVNPDAALEAAQRIETIHRQVDALALKRHFKALFVLHPYALTGQKKLTPEEQAAADIVRRTLPALNASISGAYPLVAKQRGIVDLSNIFADTTETVYLDAGHLSPAGNEKVADAIFPILNSLE